MRVIAVIPLMFSVLAVATGCVPPAAGDDEAGVTTSPEGEAGEAESTDPETSSESSGSTSMDDSGEDDGWPFIPEMDVWGDPCDPFAQDCPKGEKCVPYSSAGSTWDANKCVPVLGDRGAGEACHYAGLIVATDDCDATSLCWNVEDVDGELIGTCAPFCTGTADAPMCPVGYQCLINGEGSIALCKSTCDPLIQDCDEGLGCFFDGAGFVCAATTTDIPAGEPCGFINDCAKGNVCVEAATLPSCADPACCTPFCDLNGLGSECEALPGTMCLPLFAQGEALPGYEHVGVCTIGP